ncbi:type II toxin-antitoxin system death-on-curing family toxin [Vibrio fluvialis]
MDIEQIKYIHEYLVDYFKGSEDPVSPPGIKNEDLLKSAVARPFTSAGGEDAYVGVFNKAAALFHSVINNHCFHNGNKRAALLSALVYLGDDGWWITIPDDDELFEFTRRAAAHELTDNRADEVSIISEYFRTNTRRRQAGEHQLTLRNLRDILTGFGYELSDRVDGRTIDIYKNSKFITSILQKGSKGKENYDKQYVRKLRRKLKLTPEYGIDSYEFYGNKGFSDTLSTYMRMRDKVMRELAKI